MRTLWLIGVVTCKYKTKESFKDMWMCEGVFTTENKARKACKQDEFVVKVKINERLPENVDDVLCLYWPHFLKEKK